MKPVTITGLREWEEGRYSHCECFCNGIRVSDKLMGRTTRIKAFILERLKNSCKLIKLSGINDPDMLNTLPLQVKYLNELDACELPEWEMLNV